ncbi:glycosyltransferase [Pseudomonadales bacterium]|nr:glycosyltransferase [Pseudomonadales bacterium]
MIGSVCIVTTVHYHKDNRIYFKQALSLADAGLQVSMVTNDSWRDVDPRIEHTVLPLERFRLLRFIRLSFYRVLVVMLREKADVYHLHDPELIPAGLLLKLLRKRVVFDIHEMIPESILTKTYMIAPLRRLMFYIMSGVERVAVRFVDGVITARPDIREKFARPDIQVIHNYPILPDEAKLNKLLERKGRDGNKNFSGIYVGAMSKNRGILELIEAFADLDGIELKLLGRFENKQFEAECRASEGWHRVIYLGQVDANEIYEYIAGADFGVVTFLSAPNHLTTIATKPFEYMACGLPVIMSDFSYWRSVFSDHGVYVDPSNVLDIRESVRKLFALGSAERKRIGSANKRFVLEQCQWSIEEEKLTAFYARLLSAA